MVVLVVACARSKQRVDPSPVGSAVPPVASSAPVVFVQRHGTMVALNDSWVMNETEPMLSYDTERRPITFVLHGLCADQIWMCDWLQYGHLAPQWQLCPRGQSACGPGQYKWSGNAADTRELFTLALENAHRRHAARIRDDATVLVGMSQGAYTIASLMHEKPPFPVRGIVLQGARVRLSAADVKGVRVVLCAGEQDPAALEMKRLAESLARQGVTAKYASFGRLGHWLPVDSAKLMSELIEWARGEEHAAVGE